MTFMIVNLISCAAASNNTEGTPRSGKVHNSSRRGQLRSVERGKSAADARIEGNHSTK